MSINVNNLPTYTDADLLTIYRWALANGAAGTTRTIQGKSITFPATQQVLETISLLEMRIAAAGGGQSAAVHFNDDRGRGTPYWAGGGNRL